MMPKPTPALLQVFPACLRRIDDQDMMAVRERFEALGEHPDVLAVIEREVRTRATENGPIRVTVPDDTAPLADRQDDRSAPGEGLTGACQDS